MCGFIGYTGKIDNNKEVLSNMLSKISHRGPDSEDSYSDDNISLGFRRLSIIDLQGGSQPIYNEDKTEVLVFNGEIYNFQVLRNDLLKKGHKFYTHTDSEVLIHGYEEYGKDLLMKLRGMFSFVIWDSKNKMLFGARDFFGIKPLYYYKSEKTFIFGSEIKGFLPHPNFKKEFNEDKLSDYLTFSCIPGSDTFFKNVYKLLPGHYFEYQNGELKIDKYFNISFDIEADKDIDFFSKKISQTLEESVYTHKISDVEVGCFLSGGVDSSIVAYELSRLGKIKTFTIGFNDKRYSEDISAKELAKEIGVENEVKLINSEEYFDNIGKVQYYLDEPLANPSANLLFFLSKLASSKVKVVQSGEGADEMFGGYNVYKEPLAIARYSILPLPLRKMIAKLVLPLPEFKGKNFLIRGAKPIEERYLGNSNIFTVDEKINILKNNFKPSNPYLIAKKYYDEVKNLDDITKMQYLDMHMWMVQEILLKADKMSMASSLELRVPFLDIEIFKLARTIPSKFKVSEQNTKLALRNSTAKKINPRSANRIKMAFPLPLVEWLREEKHYNLVKQYFEGETSAKYFDQKVILGYLDEHKKSKINNARKIWTILTFLVWYEEFFVKR